MKVTKSIYWRLSAYMTVLSNDVCRQARNSGVCLACRCGPSASHMPSICLEVCHTLRSRLHPRDLADCQRGSRGAGVHHQLRELTFASKSTHTADPTAKTSIIRIEEKRHNQYWTQTLPLTPQNHRTGQRVNYPRDLVNPRPVVILTRQTPDLNVQLCFRSRPRIRSPILVLTSS